MLIHTHKKKCDDSFLIILQLKLSMLASEMLYEYQYIMKNMIKLSEKKKVIYTRNND